MRRAIDSRDGFTYIEMTITILVMGILAAVAAPTYVSSLANYRVDMAARRIIADLHYARTEAQRTSQSRTVEFDVTVHRYTLLNVVDMDNSTHTFVVELVNDPFLSTIVSASFGADSEVIFDMYGRPDSAGTIVLQSGNKQKTIHMATDGTASTL